MKSFKRWKSKLNVSLLEIFIFTLIKSSDKKLFSRDFISLSKIYLGEDIKIPTLYALLNRVVEDGLLIVEHIKYESEDENSRGTLRKYYDLTEKGVDYLALMRQKISSVDILLSFDGDRLIEYLEEKK